MISEVTEQLADASTPGADWVERFLRPVLTEQQRRTKKTKLLCLQVQPDDEDEAERVRFLGHSCEIVLWRPEEYAGKRWNRGPAIADPFRLPFQDGSFDLIFTGALGRIAPRGDSPGRLSRELSRVCGQGGAFLAALGNRFCPVDLTSARGRFHGPFHPEKYSYAEFSSALTGDGNFARIQPLSLSGHLGFRRVRAGLRFVTPWVAAWLKWASNPASPARYGSPLNPVLMILAEK